LTPDLNQRLRKIAVEVLRLTAREVVTPAQQLPEVCLDHEVRQFNDRPRRNPGFHQGGYRGMDLVPAKLQGARLKVFRTGVLCKRVWYGAPVQICLYIGVEVAGQALPGDPLRSGLERGLSDRSQSELQECLGGFVPDLRDLPVKDVGILVQRPSAHLV